jgi:hypothetical protein
MSGEEPPACTPDGPPYPPCPEGVEAGWCMDEDEQQDFDCDDPGMETDPRCSEEDSDPERERPRDSNPPSENGNENIAEEPLVGKIKLSGDV